MKTFHCKREDEMKAIERISEDESVCFCSSDSGFIHGRSTEIHRARSCKFPNNPIMSWETMEGDEIVTLIITDVRAS